MEDHYKILNVGHGAVDSEIKKQFRKLATQHHPDKSGGSKESEEVFKVILRAYEILSDKESREIYDLKYKQHFTQHNFKKFNQNDLHNKQEQYNKTTSRWEKSDNIDKNRKKNYVIWIFGALLLLVYLFISNKETVIENSEFKHQTDLEKPATRPQSGEIDFNN